MIRILAVVVVAGLAAYAAVRAGADPAIGWLVAGCLVVGGVLGARWARARRGYSDLRGSVRMVGIARRGFVTDVVLLARWLLLVALAVAVAYAGVRATRG